MRTRAIGRVPEAWVIRAMPPEQRLALARS
jgi:hypothetical protein